MTAESQRSNWRDFQDAVAALLNQIPGCVARVNYQVHGTRIANVNIDIWAEIHLSPGWRVGLSHSTADDPFIFTMIVECKYWNRTIPQDRIFSLKHIVEDIGASKGILISNKCVQKGGMSYLRHSGNVLAMTFEEFQIWVAKHRINKRFGPRDSSFTFCAHCGRMNRVPFLPSPGKTTYCKPCSEKLQTSLAQTVGFELVGDDIGQDVESALKIALAEGAVFRDADPLSIFRRELDNSIRSIQSHARGRLLQEFLLKGPYDRKGIIPAQLHKKYLSDHANTKAIAFIYSHMVNCFKGALTEMLASTPCITLLRQLQQDGEIPGDAQLYVGDAASVSHLNGQGTTKGADAHILLINHTPGSASRITLCAVVEVKSYMRSAIKTKAQLDKHIIRAHNGLVVDGAEYSPDNIRIGYGRGLRVLRITVSPDNWKLPRTFRIEPTNNGRRLHIDSCKPTYDADQIRRIGKDEWHITLRWSKEAVAAAAYGMTFWYMERIGEDIYSHGMPKEWSEMTPAEGGQNAIKMMLYYTILRCRTTRDSQRAIALYNSYGFGYSLGMNFKNSKGNREMLWVHDLDEIIDSGRTKYGCRIAGMAHSRTTKRAIK